MKAASGVGLVSLSGCMGYTVKRTQEIDDLETKLQNRTEQVEDLETEIQNQSEKIDELNQRIESLEQENSDQTDQINSLESELESEKEKQILYLYGYGMTDYNDGIDYYNRAIDYIDDENYEAARADLNVSSAYFDSAATSFGASGDQATEIGANTVQSWCETANQKASQMASATSDYQVGMAYYAEGRYNDGDDYLDRGDAHYDSAEGYEMRDRSTLEDELGTSIDS